MKKSFEILLSEVNRKKMQRHRMIALLLVLSLFVTSGVSWALHGVGLTLANEAECGIEEHVHTDECYEEQLVCGLEDDTEHVHTDECREMKLVCELPEHVHNAACYTGSMDFAALLGGSSVSFDEAVANAEGIADVVYTDDYEIESDETDEAGQEDMPVLKAPVLRAAGDSGGGSYDDQGRYMVDTIDNIAEGIKFTLFDYSGEKNGSSGDTLESQNNNYGFATDGWNGPLIGPPYQHNNVSYTGINTGRNARQDILFLAYGTPVPAGANGAGVEGGTNVYNNWNGDVHEYTPDKNSYSGDYNSKPVYSGNRPVTGIVGTTLGNDGYPYIAGDPTRSLAYLFAPNTNVGGDQSAYKTVYDGVNHEGVNHLLQKDEETGHLVYNSDLNYAYFDQSTGNFIVYGDDPADSSDNGFKGTFDIINDAHHNGGEFTGKYDENENAIYYAEGDTVDPGFKIGFFPFDPYDETRRDPNFNGNGYNHHFGMTMEAEFSNPTAANTPEPVTFKYSGDDDMWVFVDDMLVLDIGGIHEPAGGMIDFTNNLVWTQDNGNGGHDLDYVKTQLQGWGVISTEEDWEALPKPIGIDTSSTSSGSGTKWIVTKISDYIPDWNSTAHTKTHKINMFYLERGGCYSNLAMEMNLPTLKPLTVIKNVDYQQHLVKGIYENTEYTFRVWEWDSASGIWVHTQSTDSEGSFYLKGLNADGTFTLKDGERKTFDDLGQDRIFKVVEEGINPNIIGQVTVNGSPVTVAGGEASSDSAMLKDVNSYTFNNRIVEEVGPVSIKKAWAPENVTIPAGYDAVKFKILRTDTQTGEVKQVALQQGSVKTRTFVLSAEEWAQGKTIDGLLKRYGNHYYTYQVEELNVPRGFKAVYSTDDNGNLVITNTDIREMNLNVKKQWENKENPPKVQFKLTRKRVGYEGSLPTTLTVKFVDEAGNPIISYTTPAYAEGQPYSGPYVGGALELSYVIPEGAEYYSADPNYPKVTPGTMGLEVYPDDKILVVSNLAASGNEVTIKIKTADAWDSKLLQHHSFSDSDPNAEEEVRKQSWTVQNGVGTNAKAGYDSSVSYGKNGGSLLISDRSKSYNGAFLYLDPSKYFGNKTYTFSAYVYSPIADTFKMTFNNGLGDYRPIGQTNVPANTWTQVNGTVQLSGDIDPYGMFLVLESLPTNNDYTNYPLKDGGTWFRMDEFTAIEGTDPVTVSPTDGKVTVGGGSGGNVIYDFQFRNNCSDEGWSVQDYNNNNNNRTRIEPGRPNHGFDGIVVVGRNAHNDGVSIRVPNLVPGKTYHFEGQAQEHSNGRPAKTIQLSMNTGNNSYPTVVGNIQLNANNNASYEIHDFAGDFTVPTNVNQNTMTIYFETPQDSNDFGDFRLLYLTVTEPGTAAPPTDEIGYDESTGQYVTDFSDRSYQVVPDENSYTNPPHLAESGYQTEAGWQRIITLPDDSDDGASWTYHWDNNSSRSSTDPHYIFEDNSFLYEYHIEEIFVDHNGNELTKDDDGNWVDANGKVVYLVSYQNNDVDSNVPESPIVVKNTYTRYWLPDTGGMGANGYCFTGLLLAMTGMIGGYALKRRERRFR